MRKYPVKLPFNVKDPKFSYSMLYSIGERKFMFGKMRRNYGWKVFYGVPRGDYAVIGVSGKPSGSVRLFLKRIHVPGKWSASYNVLEKFEVPLDASSLRQVSRSMSVPLTVRTVLKVKVGYSDSLRVLFYPVSEDYDTIRSFFTGGSNDGRQV
ncbi:MAG: hypothetical protein QXO47_10875 [Thermoproteota archaeon]